MVAVTTAAPLQLCSSFQLFLQCGNTFIECCYIVMLSRHYVLSRLPQVGYRVEWSVVMDAGVVSASAPGEEAATLPQVLVVPLKWIEDGVYGDLIVTYPKPCSIY